MKSQVRHDINIFVVSSISRNWWLTFSCYSCCTGVTVVCGSHCPVRLWSQLSCSESQNRQQSLFVWGCKTERYLCLWVKDDPRPSCSRIPSRTFGSQTSKSSSSSTTEPSRVKGSSCKTSNFPCRSFDRRNYVRTRDSEAIQDRLWLCRCQWNSTEKRRNQRWKGSS